MFSSFTKPLTCSYQMTLITSAINVKFKELNRRVTEYMFPIEITLKLHYRLTYYHAAFNLQIKTNNEFEEKISVDFLQMRIIVLNILFY